MKSKDYAEIFDQMSFVGTRYPDLTAMAELGSLRIATTSSRDAACEADDESSTHVPEGNHRVPLHSPRAWRMCFTLNTRWARNRAGNATRRASSLLGNDRSWRVHASTAKSTHIRNPVLRYVHKALAHTIYARRDVTGVTEKELFFLNEGMKRVIRTLPDGLRWSGTESGNSVATYLLKSFLSYRVCSLSQQGAQGKQWSAELWRTHNADPHELGITLEKPVDPQAINIQYLRKSTYLRGLPSADATTISSPIGSLSTGWRVSSCQTHP
ncbi:unnamed protein product [Microthlaspi erraticum]|uniref:Arabidopsis retrotransposon Orf1 C-terminal domain-containing protein n=1 Tax=Microthlaspi erraticum TaxID=1685480 RepID=A0A6D2JG12_9BRAS|nr:unnamed protein product [Microthlaspi erraticum]